MIITQRMLDNARCLKRNERCYEKILLNSLAIQQNRLSPSQFEEKKHFVAYMIEKNRANRSKYTGFKQCKLIIPNRSNKNVSY